MKNNIKEIGCLIIQMLLFYILPLFAGPTDMMGLVLLLIVITFIIAFILGIISTNKYKFLYPLVVVVIFISSVLIYYNESAFVHAIWYFIISLGGILIGSLIRKIIKRDFRG